MVQPGAASLAAQAHAAAKSPWANSSQSVAGAGGSRGESKVHRTFRQNALERACRALASLPIGLARRKDVERRRQSPQGAANLANQPPVDGMVKQHDQVDVRVVGCSAARPTPYQEDPRRVKNLLDSLGGGGDIRVHVPLAATRRWRLHLW